MADEKMTPEQIAAAAAREAQAKATQEKAAAENAKRNGQGTRLLVGSTRGRSTQSFVYEAFDKSVPDSLPKSVAEFMVLAEVADSDAGEAAMVNYLIEGYNEVSLTAASDPVAEYIDPTWDDDVQKRFKTVIKNYSADANVSIEDAVSLLKPGIQKGIEAMKLAKATAAVVGA